MKFSANLSTLFNDIPNLLERYALILSTKFDTIECQSPYQHSIDEWRQVFIDSKKIRSQLPKFDLINSVPVFSVFKDRLPTLDEFDEKIMEQTLKYAKFLQVNKVHLVLTDSHSPADLDHILNLLSHGAKRLNEHSIGCVIEPLSIRKNYYLRCYHQAKSIVEKLAISNLKILVDSYHMQMLNGNLTQIINELKNQTGHVQISQIPLRDCPTNQGEIDFEYFLKLIANTGYSNHVGLEYNATREQVCFDWLEKFEKL